MYMFAQCPSIDGVSIFFDINFVDDPLLVKKIELAREGEEQLQGHHQGHGRYYGHDKATGDSGPWFRPILGNLLLRNKTSAQYKGDNVYIQHDLTRQEQRRRKDLVPKFRALRDKGVRCHLPRDKIINN